MTQSYSDLIHGYHICADYYGCDAILLNDIEFLEAALRSAAKEASATVLHAVRHHFEPQGVTTLLLLAESHMSIHTWPERSYAAVDVFTCGEKMQPQRALDYLKKVLKPTDESITTITRGEK